MKYWYLKNGDIIGPMTAEEIAKDNAFAEDSLVCPEDKSEQAEFWKPAPDYSQDFAAVLKQNKANQISQAEPLPNNSNVATNAKPSVPPPPAPVKEVKTESSPKLKTKEEFLAEDSVQDKKQNPAEEKNPFEITKPPIAPNVTETISHHTIAPRLNASGDTLLEEVPAKAILSSEEQNSLQETQDNAELSEQKDPLDDTPILNIFERTTEDGRNKTRELTGITENAYNVYNASNKEDPSLRIKTSPKPDIEQEEQSRKNRKIYLLLIIMFVVVSMALLLALFNPSEPPEKAEETPAADMNTQLPASPLDIQDIPTNEAASSYTPQADISEKEKALAKVKGFILVNGERLEDYLNNKYPDYQINWSGDVLSGRNYYVHFYARKVRQEPIVYSFSIDLDKNEINGLNNLGMDLLVKGE